MADIVNMMGGSSLGNALTGILMADDIQPGSMPGYQTCKDIYLHHVLGAKMAEKPVKIAMSQERRYKVVDFPGDDAVLAFKREREKLGADRAIFATRVQSRVYGISSVGLLIDGESTSEPIDPEKLWKQKIALNIYDPLNTAGSLVLNQDPRAFDFQHVREIVVNGMVFHKSKSRTIMNEFPIYISYTPSTYGFTGRSVYQRSLYPLKSFIQTMITNDMISVKAGVLVAKIKQTGSSITNVLRQAMGFKRNIVKEAVVSNVISISSENNESIESLNLSNLSEPFMTARKNIVEDIASGAPMPAKMLTEESFAQGFADGTEDAKEQARYIDGERMQMEPLYEFTDMIAQYRAWNPTWWKEMQEKYPKELGGIDHAAGFFRMRNSFEAPWPSLLTEPESEQVKVADVKLKAVIAAMQVMTPKMDPKNAAKTIQWLEQTINEMTTLFGTPLELDYTALEKWMEEHPELQKENEPKPPSPMALRV